VSLKGLSQKDSTVNDSVTISKRAAQNILIAADSLDRSTKENASLKVDIGNYKTLVNVKDQLIKVKMDSIAALQSIRLMQEQQKQIMIEQISKGNKKLKWSKFKTTISQISLLVVTGILITKL
jgi:hypothetical protein